MVGPAGAILHPHRPNPNQTEPNSINQSLRAVQLKTLNAPNHHLPPPSPFNHAKMNRVIRNNYFVVYYGWDIFLNLFYRYRIVWIFAEQRGGAKCDDDNKTNYLNNDFEFMHFRDRRGLAVRSRRASIYIVFKQKYRIFPFTDFCTLPPSLF